MKHPALFTATALVLSAAASAANAQTRIAPDGSDCAQLTGGTLVTCQNQVYESQLRSGASSAVGDDQQTVAPSSNIGSSDTDDSRGLVIGAEGVTDPDDAPAPVFVPPSGGLPGPEGTYQPISP